MSPFDQGASANADRVLSASPTAPVVAAHSGDAPLRDVVADLARAKAVFQLRTIEAIIRGPF